MKTWKIITLSVIILLLLIVNMFRQHVDDFRNERREYIQKLDFDFSAKVDAINLPGHIFFHVTNGAFDRDAEYRLNRVLKYNGRLALFLYFLGNQVEFISDSAKFYHTGDSLYFNTDKNKVYLYRDKDLILENGLLKSLRGRPF